MVAAASRPPDGTAHAGRRLAGPLPPLACAALTLAVALVGIGSPSLWLDEAATVSMTARSYGDMLRVFPHLDLVHALYYMVMKPWVAVFGTGALALRLPSALAMAAAAAGLAVIGRRCLGPPAGLAAGLVWAAGPQTSRWAQEARSYAMTAAVAVLATYLLVRALDRDEERRWRWFAGYAPAVAVLGFLHLDGALLLAAHGVTVLLTRPKAGVWLRWLASAAVATVPLVVLALAAQDQKRQVKWLPRPSWDVAWTQLQFLAGDRALVAPVVALALFGVVASVLGRASLPHRTASLPAVALPWALAPTVLLLLVSSVTDPVFYYRYTTYCLPAVALLAGAGLAGLFTLARRFTARPAPLAAARAVLVAAAAAALAVPSLRAHDNIRRQDSRPDDMRAAADVVRAHARPGDAIVYLAGSVRWSAAAYPDAFGRLRDAGVSTDPVAAANLKGRDLLPRELPPRLARADRVWVMDHRSLDPHGPVIERRERAVQSAGPWRTAGTWHYRGGRLVLFERTGPYRSSR
ncbi:glycosyltransferase family 39 protein [Actinomadura mexicana]|uniref:Mannosyltransferase n=1 Tax=Actinomadura mexicana TaxID=134959 RepID=A0A239ATU0_9ACTN|nr:glycosyltransferase family 39 protein [Actinomadura mexicana]SNR98393.1 mannosyltransferase [Actinomadura mexicana]